MADPAAIHAASIAQLQGYYGEACPTVSCQNATVKCLSSTGRSARELAMGGWAPETDRIVVVLQADLPQGGFQLGWTMTFVPTGEKYRINEIKTPQGQAQVHYGLVSLSRGVKGKA